MSKKALLFTLLAGLACGGMIGATLALTRDLPQIQSLEQYHPSAVSRIYAADGSLLAEVYSEKRDPVTLADIPPYLQKALITTEDRNFYRHSGIDLKGILRALLRDIRARAFVEGASTITQQLAKTLFLSPQKNLLRKVKEALLAIQLERRYTKNEILTLYLNQIYFGSGAYGVEAAARIFFGQSVRTLNLAQCALVAAMPKAPSRYSPLVNPSLALKRRNLVLKQMHTAGIITADELQSALQTPLSKAADERRKRLAPWFVDHVKAHLEQAIGASQLYKGGLTIHTTLDPKLQRASEVAVRKGLEAWTQRHPAHGNVPPEAALVALDVHTGAILAMVGGREYRQGAFNRAVDARRQPGSTFKPLVFASAIEKGFTQNLLLLDAPVMFQGLTKDAAWQPQNFSGQYLGEITLRKALTHSKNIPAVRLIEKLGPASVVQLARALGIQSPLEANLALALGTSSVTLLELTSAYSAFANQGNVTTPFGVAEVRDHLGRLLYRPRALRRAAVARTTAAIVTDMLQGVVQEGTARPARRLKRAVAGKTGTTNQAHDAWFVGFSPDVAAGVWVGFDQPRALGAEETGARAALPIWIDFMQTALIRPSPRYFDIPDGVELVTIDTTSGVAVTEEAPNSTKAFFLKGTAPLPPS